MILQNRTNKTFWGHYFDVIKICNKYCAYDCQGCAGCIFVPFNPCGNCGNTDGAYNEVWIGVIKLGK